MSARAAEAFSNYAWKLFLFLVSVAGAVTGLTALGLPFDIVIIAVLSLGIAILGARVIHLNLVREEAAGDVLLFHLILPTDGIKPFYNLIIESTSKCLDSVANKSWFLCPRIPTTSFDKLDIWQKYESVAEVRRTTGGVFLIADDPDVNFDKILSGDGAHSGVPLVMVDVYFDPDPRKYDEINRAKFPSFVGGDEVAGGAIAAEILAPYVTSRAGSVTNPRVIVVRGGNTAWETQRTESFKTTLCEKVPCEFESSDHLFYSRSESYDWIYQKLVQLEPTDYSRYCGIFAANDDMALGARNALRDIRRIRGSARIDIPIVGYDGTPEMIDLIKRNDPYVAGTVNVRIDEQCRTAVYVMKELLQGKETTPKVHLIKPRPFTRKRALDASQTERPVDQIE